MLDNDWGNFMTDLAGGNVERAVAETVRECPPEVTTYLLCSGAGNSNYPTRVALAGKGMKGFHDQGIDPFGMLLRAIKAAGKETFITLRMNDVHNPTEEWNKPRIRREHPEFVVGIDEIKAGQSQWMSYCLDYRREAVRQCMLDMIAEQVELYGDALDGFQLDWMRFPRHLSGSPEEVWEQRSVLTDFTREVRSILRRGGRQILLCARVPTNPAGCHNLGLDLAGWGKEGLVDLLVGCPFLNTEWKMPIGEMRQLLGNTSVPVVGGFDFEFGRQPHFPESLRGICTSIYDCGSDGVYIFNFPCWNEYMAARPYHWLAGLGRPETAAAKPLLLAVEHRHNRKFGADQPGQLPVKLQPNGALDLSLHVPRAALPAWRALALAHSHGNITLSVNDREAELVAYSKGWLGGQRHALFMDFAMPHKMEERVKPEDCRVFRVAPEHLLPGGNRISLKNKTDHELEIESLNLGLW